MANPFRSHPKNRGLSVASSSEANVKPLRKSEVGRLRERVQLPKYLPHPDKPSANPTGRNQLPVGGSQTRPGLISLSLRHGCLRGWEGNWVRNRPRPAEDRNVHPYRLEKFRPHVGAISITNPDLPCHDIELGGPFLGYDVVRFLSSWAGGLSRPNWPGCLGALFYSPTQRWCPGHHGDINETT